MFFKVQQFEQLVLNGKPYDFGVHGDEAPIKLITRKGLTARVAQIVGEKLWRILRHEIPLDDQAAAVRELMEKIPSTVMRGVLLEYHRGVILEPIAARDAA
jgi:hypothetical protein